MGGTSVHFHELLSGILSIADATAHVCQRPSRPLQLQGNSEFCGARAASNPTKYTP